MLSRRSVLSVAIAVLLCVAASTPRDRVASASENSLKAAFIYRIASFVSWPVEALGPEERAFRVVVVGDPDLAGHVEHAFANQRMQGRPVSVIATAAVGQVENAQLVFISDHVDPSALLQRAAAEPILTIGDADGFATHGGIVELVRDGTRLRFEVNAGNAKRSGLKLSSQVLRLASQVHGDSSDG